MGDDGCAAAAAMVNLLPSPSPQPQQLLLLLLLLMLLLAAAAAAAELNCRHQHLHSPEMPPINTPPQHSANQTAIFIIPCCKSLASSSPVSSARI
jgi:hypothetical protein